MTLKKGVTVHSGKETFKGELPDEKAVKIGLKKPEKEPVKKDDK
jgi:hypothetical protein